MRILLSVVQITVATVLFLAGAVLALDARYLHIDSWQKLRRVTEYAIFGKPTHVKLKCAFEEAAFGNASLRTNASQCIPNADDVDRNVELLSGFADGSAYRRLSSGVGRIDLLVDEVDKSNQKTGKKHVSPCTFSLVTERVLITALHCLPLEIIKGRAPFNAYLRFGYLKDSEDVAGEGRGYPAVLTIIDHGAKTYVAASEADKDRASETIVDYALMEIAEATADQIRSDGYVTPPRSDTPILPQSDLFVIHHPLGGALRLSRRNCRATGNGGFEYGAESQNLGANDVFQHSCGTLPGTSGAPVFDDHTRTIVALHVRGDLSAISTDQNQGWALPLRRVVSDLKPENRYLQDALLGRTEGALTTNAVEGGD